jgi:hypothetical protein
MLITFRLGRILLAGIRNLGLCPCPRCLVHLSKTHHIGTARDKAIRSSSLRVDDTKRRSLVSSARRIIYEEGYGVKSAAVEDLLKLASLVPNKVRCQKPADMTKSLTYAIECFIGFPISTRRKSVFLVSARLHA